MSRSTYESLFDGPQGGDPAEDMVRALALAGRLRRSAYELATDEMMEGTWVEEVADESEMRLAADDRSLTERTYAGGGYTIVVQRTLEGVHVAQQLSGPSGATLRLADKWIPLEPGVSVELPLDGMPDLLVLMDLKGREISLR